MKLPLLRLVVFLFSPVTGELRSSLPHSVCVHKKTSLHWLASATLGLRISCLNALFLRGLTLPLPSLPSVHYSNSK